MTFKALLELNRGKDFTPPKKLLALDPGETIGWSVFEDGELILQGQTYAKENMCQAISELFLKIQPSHVICEDYVVYAHKASIHINQELFTPKLIGMIHLLCYQNNISITYQLAVTAKGFCQDAKLKEWDYYKKGQKHSRDSIRHGCFYLLFKYKEE